MKNIPEFQSSHAILLFSGKYVLQLRDDIPTISAPGEWSFFGGMIEKGESPIEGIKREIFEELGIRPEEFKELWYEDYFDTFKKDIVRNMVFCCRCD